MPDEVRMLLIETTKKRAPTNSKDQSNLIEVNKEFAESIDVAINEK